MVKKMKFEYSQDITAVNQKQYEEHLKLYEGYVNKLNEIDEIQKTNPEYSDANATYSHFRGLKRGETFALDGVILHELYFSNMGGTQKEPDPLVLSSLKLGYPTYDVWKQEFIATGKASRGWAVLIWDQRTRRFRNISLDAHDVGDICLGYPVLVLDVYEHAYFGQYGTDKAQYINRFMENINWTVVSQRLAKI